MTNTACPHLVRGCPHEDTPGHWQVCHACAEDARLRPAERRVAELAAEGLPNKLIAKRLHRSIQTIKNEVTSIHHRLGISNRVELARWIWEHEAE